MSPNGGLLKVAVFLCVFFCTVRLGEFVYSRVPPYAEGQCIIVGTLVGFDTKIKENHIVGGYSDVEITVFSNVKQIEKVSFTDLRNPLVVGKVQCSN